jgi:hypothetical protein
MRRSAQAGIDVRYVGTTPLFTETRLLVGTDKNWVVMPVENDPTLHRGRLPIPADQRHRLETLVAAGCHFPAVFSAHEVDPAKLSGKMVARGDHSLDTASTAILVGSAPPTPGALARSEKLGDWTETVGRSVRLALAITGAVAAVPILVAAAASAGAAGALGGLDPVLFGVIPSSGRLAPGELAAWVLLAQWTW